MSRFPASPDFDHRIADWLEDDPDRAPGAVLSTVLAALPSISQRRASRVPWRYQLMSRFALLGAAAATIAVVGLGGLLLAFRPNEPDTVGGPPITSPAPSPSPSLSPSPSATTAPSLPPPLTETFTSSVHGISIAYPAGWGTSPATAPWTTTDWPLFRDPAGDYVYDESLTDHLFILLASQPLAGETGDWAADILAQEDCGETEPVTIDGASGLIGDCGAAAVRVGDRNYENDRGYLVALHRSADRPWIRDLYDRAWFERLLATVDLRPEDAVDAAPSPAG
jgi:hypothetical protein